jgi:hypothetical protein
VTPDRVPRKGRRATKPHSPIIKVRTGPSPDDHHDVAYFRRHRDDDQAETAPGRDFLRRCPPAVRAKFAAVLVAVATAPPKRFAGGGYWEAMHGDMVGWFEVRVDGPSRRHFRLFCLLDYDAVDRSKPLLTVVTGMDKPFRGTLSDSDYKRVRQLGAEYRARNPRSLS